MYLNERKNRILGKLRGLTSTLDVIPTAMIQLSECGDDTCNNAIENNIIEKLSRKNNNCFGNRAVMNLD